jgi:hypothetical protein
MYMFMDAIHTIGNSIGIPTPYVNATYTILIRAEYLNGRATSGPEYNIT